MPFAWIVLCFTLLFSQAAQAVSNDDLFASARDAYKSRNDSALELYAQQLHGQKYILAPYADYWLMLLRLNQADNATVRDFMERYADYPFTDRLRGEWLKQLGRTQDWATFYEELPKFRRDDVAISCYALDGKPQQAEAEARKAVEPLWLVAVEQPSNCNAVFDRLFQRGVLTTEDLWQRFRLALLGGKVELAKSIANRNADIDSSKLKLLDRVYKNPQQALEKRSIALTSRFGRELNLYALDKLARTQPLLAMTQWQQTLNAYGAEDRNYMWARMALHAARGHDPAALDLFGKVKNAALNQEQIAWKARAALREKNWPALLATINAMPASLQEEGAWRYWKARALREQKQLTAANAILVPLSKETNFYGLLAQEDLGDILSAPSVPYKAADADIQAVFALAGIQRALELQRIDMRWEGKLEWAAATRDFDDRQLLAAAEIAARANWYDISINTAEKTMQMHDFALRYPTPFQNVMQNYTRENDLDEAWVYGLIRQESRFIGIARSGAGASGLMQVMPATAKWIAKRLGLGDYQAAMINQLDINLQFGTHYLRYTLDQMSGQPVMATAAYNAGPGRPKRWAAAQPLEGAIYAETIPFTETRDYVKKVMSNAYFYAQRLGTKTISLKQRLGTIDGTESASAPQADESE